MASAMNNTWVAIESVRVNGLTRDFVDSTLPPLLVALLEQHPATIPTRCHGSDKELPMYTARRANKAHTPPGRGSLTLTDVISTLSITTPALAGLPGKKSPTPAAHPGPARPPLARANEALPPLATILQATYALEASLDRLITRREVRDFGFCLRTLAAAAVVPSNAQSAASQLENQQNIDHVVSAIEILRFFLIPPGFCLDGAQTSAFDRNADLFLRSDGFQLLSALCRVSGQKIQSHVFSALLADLPAHLLRHPDVAVTLKILCSSAFEDVAKDSRRIRGRLELLESVGPVPVFQDIQSVTQLLLKAQTERELTKVLWHLSQQSDYSLLTDDILHFIYREELVNEGSTTARASPPPGAEPTSAAGDTQKAPNNPPPINSSIDIIDLVFYCFTRDEPEVLRLAHTVFSRLWLSCDEQLRKYITIRLVRGWSEANAAGWAKLVKMLYRTRFSRQLLIQVVVEHLTGAGATLPDADRAARIFSLVAQFSDKPIFADFFFRCFLQPSQLQDTVGSMSDEMLRSGSFLLRDSSSEKISAFPTLPKSPHAVDELPDGGFSRTVSIVVSEVDLVVRQSRVAVAFESEPSILRSSFGIMLAIKRLIQMPVVVASLIRLRVIKAMLHMAFQSMSVGNIELRRLSEDVIYGLESGPHGETLRPLLFSLLGQQQARDSAKLLHQKHIIFDLSTRVERLTDAVQQQQRAIDELFTLLATARHSPLRGAVGNNITALRLDDINKPKRNSEPSPRSAEMAIQEPTTPRRKKKKHSPTAPPTEPAEQDGQFSPRSKKKSRNSAPSARKRSSTITGTSPPNSPAGEAPLSPKSAKKSKGRVRAGTVRLPSENRERTRIDARSSSMAASPAKIVRPSEASQPTSDHGRKIGFSPPDTIESSTSSEGDSSPHHSGSLSPGSNSTNSSSPLTPGSNDTRRHRKSHKAEKSK